MEWCSVKVQGQLYLYVLILKHEELRHCCCEFGLVHVTSTILDFCLSVMVHGVVNSSLYGKAVQWADLLTHPPVCRV